jgi:uncharacterized membrane protein YsdA (DUF1294 family)
MQPKSARQRQSRRKRRVSPYRKFALLYALAGGVVIIALEVLLRGHWYLDWLLGWSAITFLVYGWDKRQAIRHGERVPELVLHGLALIGGVVGAWAGRGVFHHKTLRRDFTVVLIAATFLHAAIIAVLLVTFHPAPL